LCPTAPPSILADLFLYSYESEFLQKLVKDKKIHEARAFNFTFRYIDDVLKGTQPGTIPARFGLIWFSGFRGEDLNVIFYQNMSNLYNQYKSVERKNSQKNPEYVLIYSLSCSCS
jgi:hypothetical protein